MAEKIPGVNAKMSLSKKLTQTCAVVIVPLLLTLSWGTQFADDVYEMLPVVDLFFIEQTSFALVVSAIGWSVIGIAFLMIGRAVKRPFAAAISALLISFNPFIIITLGSETSWVLASIWLVMAFGFMRRWIFMMLAFFGFLLILLLAWPPNEADLLAAGWTSLIFLAGIGFDWLITTLATRNYLRLGYQQTSRIILVGVFIMLGIWQTSS